METEIGVVMPFPLEQPAAANAAIRTATSTLLATSSD